jgi:acyl-CoA thioesterase
MTEPTRTPQQTAEYVRDGMLANDNATKGLNMRIVEVGPGQATIEMRVRPDMLNGHATCHGGFMATLADSTFAFACNSYNELTVAWASQHRIHQAPAPRRRCAHLRACHEVSKAGTACTTPKSPTSAASVVAMFRGRS